MRINGSKPGAFRKLRAKVLEAMERHAEESIHLGLDQIDEAWGRHAPKKSHRLKGSLQRFSGALPPEQAADDPVRDLRGGEVDTSGRFGSASTLIYARVVAADTGFVDAVLSELRSRVT